MATQWAKGPPQLAIPSGPVDVRIGDTNQQSSTTNDTTSSNSNNWKPKGRGQPRAKTPNNHGAGARQNNLQKSRSTTKGIVNQKVFSNHPFQKPRGGFNPQKKHAYPTGNGGRRHNGLAGRRTNNRHFNPQNRPKQPFVVRGPRIISKNLHQFFRASCPFLPCSASADFNVRDIFSFYNEPYGHDVSLTIKGSETVFHTSTRDCWLALNFIFFIMSQTCKHSVLIPTTVYLGWKFRAVSLRHSDMDEDRGMR